MGSHSNSCATHKMVASILKIRMIDCLNYLWSETSTEMGHKIKGDVVISSILTVAFKSGILYHISCLLTRATQPANANYMNRSQWVAQLSFLWNVFHIVYVFTYNEEAIIFQHHI